MAAAGDVLDPAPGRLLVAAPALVDPNFARTVVLLLDVNDEGCLGVVLNRPGDVDVGEVLESWRSAVDEPHVLFRGGPVSPDAALGVATLAACAATDPPVGWRPLFDGCGLVDLDAPVEIVAPTLHTLRIYAGYAGWGAGQLEGEIADGAWFVVEGTANESAPCHTERLWADVLRRQSTPLSWLASYPEDPALN